MTSESITCRRAFGRCRRLQEQANRNLDALARAVQEAPGLRIVEYCAQLRGTTWKNPAAAIGQHIRSGLGTLRRHGLVHRDGRLWRLDP